MKKNTFALRNFKPNTLFLVFITVLITFITLPFGLFSQDSTKIVSRIPFDGMDLTWITGQNRQKDFPLVFEKDGKTILTGVAYLDAYYNYNLANPLDNTQTISATVGRHNEFTLSVASIGIESNYKNVIGRLWLQYGQMASLVQDTDGSVNKGRNTSINNLKYIREAAAGYHFDKWYGVNIEMGIFMSYIGLESYITQENWNYQRSILCEFTPFYFSGARIQAYPSKKYKTELWLLNGWQSYNSYSNSPGLGQSNYYRPNENVQLVANFYIGRDTPSSDSLGRQSKRMRFHHDNSAVVRYYKQPTSKGISQAAFSINTHYGFQSNNEQNDRLSASENFMTGVSVANRIWFNQNKLGLSVRGDYLVNQSVVNGVNVSPYLAFSPANAGNKPNNFDTAVAQGENLKIFQFTTTFDVMPNDHVTFRFEYVYHNANVPYFTSRNGTTSPSGLLVGGTPTQIPWAADLQKNENRITVSVNVRL